MSTPLFHATMHQNHLNLHLSSPDQLLHNSQSIPASLPVPSSSPTVHSPSNQTQYMHQLPQQPQQQYLQHQSPQYLTYTAAQPSLNMVYPDSKYRYNNMTPNSNMNIGMGMNMGMNMVNMNMGMVPVNMTGMPINIADYNTENVSSTNHNSPQILTATPAYQPQHDFTPPNSATISSSTIGNQEYSTAAPSSNHPPSHFSFSDHASVGSNSQPMLLVQNQPQKLQHSKSFSYDSYNNNNNTNSNQYYDNHSNKIGKLPTLSNPTNSSISHLSQYAKSNLLEDLNNQQQQQQSYGYPYNYHNNGIPNRNNYSVLYDKVIPSATSDHHLHYQQQDYNNNNTVYNRMSFVDNNGGLAVSVLSNNQNPNANVYFSTTVTPSIHTPITPTNDYYRNNNIVNTCNPDCTLNSSNFPEITESNHPINHNDLVATTQIQPYTEIMYDSDSFIGKNHDFKLSSRLDDKSTITTISNPNLKTLFDDSIVDSEIKTIVSKLNSTQLQKFAETKYYAVSGSTVLPEIALNKFIFGGATNDEILLKENIVNSWNLTRSAITVNSCACGDFIWMGPNHTGCPHDKDAADENQAVNHNLKEKPQQSLMHKKQPHVIELFNNYILSILLNKKLRIFLKKTLRPSKMIKENRSYINLIQDGTIYKEAIANDVENIDFAFTFSLITPTIPGLGIKGNNLSCVYFVLNELPDYLRYRPEFMFLACAVNSDNSLEYNKATLFPLFEYINHLQNTVLRISLNRHEYHVKVSMIMALANDQYGKGGLLNINSSNSVHQCSFCNVPRCTIRDNLGHEFKPIYNCETFQTEMVNKGLYDDKITANQSTLDAVSILEPLKHFDHSKGLIIDSEKWMLEKLFKNTIIWIVKNHFRSNPNDYVYLSFKKFVEKIQGNIARHGIFEDSNILLRFTDPMVTEVNINASMPDLKIIQNLFHFLFSIYYHEIYETSSNMFYILPEKFKVLSWLIELNSYITALFCTEVDKEKIPVLRDGLKSLISELEDLSRYDMFKNINYMLTLPLHNLVHLYEKWEQIGDFSAISMSYMNESIDVFKKLSENNTIDEVKLQDRIKCLSIVNSMRVYKFQKPEYPDIDFLNAEFIDINKISNKSKIKFDEFPKKFLFDAIELPMFNQCTQIEEITSFKLNSIIIKPEDRSTALNLVRIKGIKKGSNWRYVHVHGMKRATYNDPFTKEKVTGVFIEYKETRTKKRFQRASPNRPAFSLGEYLTLKSSSKELRCVWLDDINMVALRVLTESHWIYDPKILLERAFDI